MMFLYTTVGMSFIVNSIRFQLFREHCPGWFLGVSFAVEVREKGEKREGVESDGPVKSLGEWAVHD